MQNLDDVISITYISCMIKGHYLSMKLLTLFYILSKLFSVILIYDLKTFKDKLRFIMNKRDFFSMFLINRLSLKFRYLLLFTIN